MMKTIQNQTFDMERALYGSHELSLYKCAFDGPADGESALKESTDIELDQCYCNLRYPFWHDYRLKISNTEMTPLCRAALWYSDQIEIFGARMHGIKALRECSHVLIENCDIISPEFGWSVCDLQMRRCTAQGEYFLLRSQNIHISELKFKGKYAFQYIHNAVFENCSFDTKDAFWHAKNVTVRNSTVRGEYLGWYSEGLTLINCKISGTQPLCYCKNLILINCEMAEADLAFEKSEVEATVTTPVISIKNPYSGRITVPAAEEIIMDDVNAACEILLGSPECQAAVLAGKNK